MCEATSRYVHCKCSPACSVFISTGTHLVEPIQQFTCMGLCTTGVCTSVFIGLCVKRLSNLITAQRVSTCDSRDIQTPDQYLDGLSDNDSLGRYGQIASICVFFCRQLGHHHGSRSKS